MRAIIVGEVMEYGNTESYTRRDGTVAEPMPRIVLYQAGGEIAEIVSPGLSRHRFVKGQVVAFTANVIGARGGRPGVRQAQLLAPDDVTQLVLLGFGPSKNGDALQDDRLAPDGVGGETARR